MQSPAEQLAALPEAERNTFIDSLSEEEAADLLHDWRGFLARPNQIAPEGDWDIWLLLAGRGFGKTRTGAEWVKEEVDAGNAKRIALVAETAADGRDVLVEGDSGILSVYPESERPLYEPSKRRITWKNGALPRCITQLSRISFVVRNMTLLGLTSWPSGNTPAKHGISFNSVCV